MTRRGEIQTSWNPGNEIPAEAARTSPILPDHPPSSREYPPISETGGPTRCDDLRMEPIPNWPVLMTTEVACAYVSLGEQSFRFITRKRSVSPVDCEGLAVTRWRKADLDRLVESLPVRGAQVLIDGANDDNAAELALARIRHRAKGQK
jgi:hypothetical protein